MGGATMLRWSLRVLAVLLALVLVAAAVGVWWVGQTGSFLRWSLARAEAATGGALQAGVVRGTLLGGFRVEWLHWKDDERDVRLEEVFVSLRPGALLHGELRIGRVEVARLQVSLRAAGETAAAAPPDSLALPIDVRVDALGIGRLTIERRPAEPDAARVEPLVLERVSVAGRYRDAAYRIDRFAVVSPRWGEANLQGVLGARAPFDLEFVLEAALRVALAAQPELTLPGIRLLADGTLQAFSVVAQALPPPVGPPRTAPSTGGSPAGPAAPGGSAPGAAGSPGAAPSGGSAARGTGWIGVDTFVRPFAASLPAKLDPVEIVFDAVEPTQFGLRGLPDARLSGQATLRLGEGGAIGGELRVENARPGAVDDGLVPLHALRGVFDWTRSVLSVRELQATLDGDARVAGAVALDFARPLDVLGRSLPALRGEWRVDDVDLSRLRAELGATRLSGSIRVDRERLDADLVDASREDIGLAAALRLAGSTLQVERARLRTPVGALEASGRAALAEPWRIDLAGRFAELDPAGAEAMLVRFGVLAGPARLADWGGRVGGAWTVRGRAGPEPALETSLSVESGVLAGEPLRLRWRGDVAGARVTKVDASLDYRGAHASAQGALGRTGDRLRVSARVDALGRFDPRASGSARVDGELRGGWQDAALGLAGRVSARGLGWEDTARVAALSGTVDVPDLSRGRVAVDATADGVVANERELGRVRLRVDGDVDAHAIRLDASGAELSARVAAAGAWTTAGDAGWRWQGRLDAAEAERPVALRLVAPASVQVDAQGFELGASSWRVDGAAVELSTLAWRDGSYALRGSAEKLPVGRWAHRAAPDRAAGSIEGAREELDTLSLDAQWDLHGDSPQTPTGRLRVVLQGGAAGEQRGEANVALEAGRLGGNVDLHIPTLAFANRAIGPAWGVAGRLRFRGELGGTVVAPRVDGELDGRSLALVQRELGWRLVNGTLDARFEGDRLVLRRLRLESGEGAITMEGTLRLDGLQGAFDLRADRLPVPLGPGERIVVSGATTVTSRQADLRWTGDLRVDEGLIELRGGEAPRLPDDVVIVGREQERAASVNTGTRASAAPDEAKRSDGLRVAAQLKLDLGEKLRVRGSGVDVLLAGALDLRGDLPASPLAYGTVRVAQGTYSAYGQELQITRGRVVFDGPIDNPVLDIVAMRLGRPVEAGVAVTGTVLSPRVRLVSNPDVPDTEKLSWLVLGVGFADARSGAQMAALRAAAASLLGSGGSSSGGIAQSLGLDVLTIRSARSGDAFDPDFGATFPGQPAGAAATPSAEQDVVAIGKRLGSRVLVTYEQGLRGVWNLLRIQYEITDRLSLRAQTGTDTALDLLYSFAFD